MVVFLLSITTLFISTSASRIPRPASSHAACQRCAVRPAWQRLKGVWADVYTGLKLSPGGWRCAHDDSAAQPRDGELLRCPSTTEPEWPRSFETVPGLQPIAADTSVRVSVVELPSRSMSSLELLTEMISSLLGVLPASGGGSSVVPAGSSHEFAKGDLVQYAKPGAADVFDVTVAAVHRDDPDGIYYTVVFPNGRERETIASNLRRVIGTGKGLLSRAHAVLATSPSKNGTTLNLDPDGQPYEDWMGILHEAFGFSRVHGHEELYPRYVFHGTGTDPTAWADNGAARRTLKGNFDHATPNGRGGFYTDAGFVGALEHSFLGHSECRKNCPWLLSSLKMKNGTVLQPSVRNVPLKRWIMLFEVGNPDACYSGSVGRLDGGWETGWRLDPPKAKGLAPVSVLAHKGFTGDNWMLFHDWSEVLDVDTSDRKVRSPCALRHIHTVEMRAYAYLDGNV